MLTIWGRANGLNPQKLMWCVAELRLDYVRIDHGGKFGGNDAAWYRAMNPNGRVPTIDDNGFVLWESNTIMRYLCEKYGGGDLWPGDIQDRALCSKWMDWQLGTLRESVMPIFYQLIRKTPEQRDAALLKASMETAVGHFRILDRQLAETPYLAGDHLTLADMGNGVLTWRWFNLDIERPSVPHVEAWFERLQQRPAYREHVMMPLT